MGQTSEGTLGQCVEMSSERRELDNLVMALHQLNIW